MKEQHGLAGRVWITLTDPQTGTVVEERFIKNHIMLSGRILLAKLFTMEAKLSQLKIVIGTGNDKQNDATVKLEDIKIVDEASATAKLLTEDVNNKDKATVSVEATFVASNSSHGDLMEAGIVLVTDKNEPILYNRVTFPIITRSSNLDITFRWEVIF